MTTVNEAADIVTGTYGKLTITYRRLLHTWTITVNNGELRIGELCATYDNAHAAWREAQRVATAAFAGVPVADIIAAKPSERVLAEVKQILDSQPVVPTRTNVHRKPLTPAELDLIRQHVNGVVKTKPGQSWTVLRAIVRRGYGEPIYKGSSRIIGSVRLNARGLVAAEQELAA